MGFKLVYFVGNVSNPTDTLIGGDNLEIFRVNDSKYGGTISASLQFGRSLQNLCGREDSQHGCAGVGDRLHAVPRLLRSSRFTKLLRLRGRLQMVRL